MVRDIMEVNVPAVYPDYPIESVLELSGGIAFLESTKKFEERLRKRNRLPVAEHGRMTGVGVLDALTAE